jgi:hypothetical protein
MPRGAIFRDAKSDSNKQPGCNRPWFCFAINGDFVRSRSKCVRFERAVSEFSACRSIAFGIRNLRAGIAGK